MPFSVDSFSSILLKGSGSVLPVAVTPSNRYVFILFRRFLHHYHFQHHLLCQHLHHSIVTRRGLELAISLINRMKQHFLDDSL
jgi:hypothetical protein